MIKPDFFRLEREAAQYRQDHDIDVTLKTVEDGTTKRIEHNNYKSRAAFLSSEAHRENKKIYPG